MVFPLLGDIVKRDSDIIKKGYPDMVKKDGEHMDFVSSANEELKKIISENHIYLSEIAREYNCSERKIRVALSKELPTSTKEHFRKVLGKIVERHEKEEKRREELQASYVNQFMLRNRQY